MAKWLRYLLPQARKDGEKMPPDAREHMKTRFRELSELDNPTEPCDVVRLHGVQIGEYRLKPNGCAHGWRAFFDVEPFEKPDHKGRKGALKIQAVRKRNESTYR